MAFLNSRIAVLVAALLSGLLLGVAFPPSDYGFLAFFGLVPLLLVLDRSRPALQALLACYLSMFVFHGVTHWFFAVLPFQNNDDFLGWLGVAHWLLNPLLLALPYIAHHSLVRSYGLRSALILFPFTLTAFEWLKTFGLFWSPELSLGYSLVEYTTLIQAADIAGVWGLTFFIAFINAAALWALLAIVPRLMRKGDFGPRTFVRTLYFIAFSFVLLTSYGLLRRQSIQVDMALNGHKAYDVALVQGAVNTWEKWDAPVDGQLERHLRLSYDIKDFADSTSAGRDRPLVTVWPETAIPLNMRSDQGLQILDSLQEYVDSSGSALIFGAIDSTARGHYNAAFLLNPSALVQVFHKVKLTPFAERSPLDDLLEFGQKFGNLFGEQSAGVSAWTAGDSAKVLNVQASGDQLAFAPLICIESVHPNYLQELLEQDADVVLVLSNDAWADGTGGPDQHFNMSILRAVESRRWLVRAANTGITGLISPEGEVQQRSQNGEHLRMDVKVYRSSLPTLYARFGDILPFAAVCLYGLGLFGQLFVRQENVNMRMPPPESTVKAETTGSDKSP